MKVEKKAHLEKRVFMAKKEVFNKSESAIDVIINLNQIVEDAAGRWDVNYEYLMEWFMETLPLARTLPEEASNVEEDDIE